MCWNDGIKMQELQNPSPKKEHQSSQMERVLGRFLGEFYGDEKSGRNESFCRFLFIIHRITSFKWLEILRKINRWPCVPLVHEKHDIMATFAKIVVTIYRIPIILCFSEQQLEFKALIFISFSKLNLWWCFRCNLVKMPSWLKLMNQRIK